MNKVLSILLTAFLAFVTSCKEQDNIPVASVFINQTSLSLHVGESEKLKATVLPDNASDNSVKWSSSSPDVASVTDGVVTALAEGSSTITAQAGRKLAVCTVDVSKAYVSVTSVVLSPVSMGIEIGQTKTISATVLPYEATDKSITWKSSDPAVATIIDGAVTGVSEGIATIIASAGEKYANCEVTVTEQVIAVKGVTISQTELELNRKQSFLLKATVIPENATDKSVTWASTDTEVAVVSDYGLVSGIEPGSAIITVKTNDGDFSATCSVTVKGTPVESVSLNKDSISLEKGQSESLIATVYPEDATDKKISWSSSNSSIASVSESGLVTANAVGTATITVRTQDGGHEDSCKITVILPPPTEGSGTLDDYDIVPYPFDPDDPSGDWDPEEHVDLIPFHVTNEYIQNYLDGVTYSETDYSYTLIYDYPGGGPGTADLPPTYTIKWTARPAAGDLQLHIWTEGWSWTYTLSTGASKKDISNLTPGREYHYEISSAGSGKELAHGSFTTTGRLHQVYFEPNGRNGRDLGGWKAAGGKTVTFGKIYRGGRIDGNYTNNNGKNEMRAMEIGAEIDLRKASEVFTESPLGTDIDYFAPEFETGYNHMVRENPEKVAACFTFIVARLRENKSVYFHCNAGRDRTGTLAMLLLGVLGVSGSDISKDYELTYFAPDYWSIYNGEYVHNRSTWNFNQVIAAMADTGKSTFQEQVESFFLANGVPQKDIDDFKAIMLK